MTREYRYVKVIVREAIAEEIERKYNRSLEDAVFEIVNETVCKRIFNNCSRCGRTIYLFVLEKDQIMAEKMEVTKKAICYDCDPASNWKVVK